MRNQQNSNDEFGGFGESDLHKVNLHHLPKKVNPKSPAQDLFLMYNRMFRLKKSSLL